MVCPLQTTSQRCGPDRRGIGRLFKMKRAVYLLVVGLALGCSNSGNLKAGWSGSVISQFNSQCASSNTAQQASSAGIGNL